MKVKRRGIIKNTCHFKIARRENHTELFKKVTVIETKKEKIGVSMENKVKIWRYQWETTAR